jgi:hypothetical protein
MKTSNIQLRTNRALLTLGLALAGLCTVSCASANVIGYYNVPLTRGYHFVANQFNTTNNSITGVIPSPLPTTSAYLWNVTNQEFQLVGVFDEDASAWLEPVHGEPCEVQLPPGLGFVLWSPGDYTVTFVGEVLQGGLTNFVAGTNKLSLLGSKVPQGGELTGALGFPVINSADVYTFSSASQSYADAYTALPSYGWYDPAGSATTNGPTINVGQSFFVRNPGPDTNWLRSFTVQFAGPLQVTGKDGAPVEIRSLSLSAGTVTLSILNPSGAKYNVQFSSDRVIWKTLATNQGGTVWTGPVPGGVQGYFQLVNP